MTLVKNGLFALAMTFGVFTSVQAQSDSISPQAQEVYNEGVSAFEQAKWTEAERFFSQAIQFSPGFTKAYQNRAFTYLELKKEEEAKGDFTTWARLDPQAHVALFELGILSEKAKQLSEASSYYQQALSLSPLPKYAYQLGVTQFAQKHFEDAVTAFTTCIAQDPRHVFAYHDRGSAYRELGKWTEAISDYQQAAELDPSFALAWSNLGTTYRKKGDVKAAVSAYQKATQLATNNPIFWNNLGFAQSEINELDAAVKSFQKAMQVDANYAFAYANLAGVLIKQQKYKEAISACDQAIQLDGEIGSAWYNRGVAKEMLRDQVGACADWERAAELGVATAQTYFQTSDCSNQ